MIRAAVSASLQMALVGAVVAASIALASRRMLASHPVAEASQAHFTWPKGTLLLIGLLICSGMLAEGVMYNWSVLYVIAGAPRATGEGGDGVRRVCGRHGRDAICR